MNTSKTINYFFFKSPLIRLITLLLLISAVLGGIYIFRSQTKPTPVIDAISPPVGSPGDVVVISGRNFGKERDMNYVEFGGSRLTSSSYLMWTDNTIKVVIPANVQDGLVIVASGKLRSKPAFFANAADIPVEVNDVQLITTPVITKLSCERGDLKLIQRKVAVGQLITIEGNNFGASRGSSRVLFSGDYEDKSNAFLENLLPASEDDFCYEYWSNTEIKVRVPDGAVSGYVIVDTPSGRSDPEEIQLESRVGNKKYKDKKFYLLQYSVDIADIVTQSSSTITLRCPLPVENANQNNIEMPEVSPEPVLENYQKTMIHQLNVEKSTPGKTFFKQSFVVPVYNIETSVNEITVSTKNGDLSDVLFAVATRSDELIPSDNEEIAALAKQIVKAEKNPYRRASLVYNYMIKNFEIQEKFRKNDANPLDLLKDKKGDAYDFAVIYTALLRSMDIPAFADCGVLVSPDLSTRNHMWSEFYISGIGWIPVDPALGAGMEYNKWDDNINSAEYYFGNMDSHHIKFSRGINLLKPFSQNSKIVQRPRSFAFQTIWEEASNGTVKYSSYWSDPVVKGIY